MDVDVLMDGGAYVTLSPVVLSRGAIHAAGPYRCDNTRIAARAVMTNTPPNGAFRGFGAPQTQFAMEVHMDRIAEALGMDPVRLRELNALRPGDTTATGQTLGDDCSALQALRTAVRKSRLPAQARRRTKGTNRGIGVALFYHGSGFTGSGELHLASRAALELTERACASLTSSTEIGQGTRTMHAQIVADALGVPYEDVDVAAARHRRACRTAARPLRRAPAWSSAASFSAARRSCVDRSATPHAAEYFRAARPVARRAGVRAARLDPLGRRRRTAATRTRPMAGGATSPRSSWIP